MIDTGPQVPITQDFIAAAERAGLLRQMGAPDIGGVWHRYLTADAVIDPGKGVLYIAVDTNPDPDDWEMVCRLISAVGYDNRHWPLRRDPGEPLFDALSGVYMWHLEYV